MGFGHRVYKTWDPRALILKEYSKKFCKIEEMNTPEDGIDNLFEMIELLADFMITKKNIYPNMDL